MKKILFLMIAFLLFSSSFTQNTFANDTALSALGDNVGPFQGTPDVVLDHEVINLDVYLQKTIVDVTFFLKNVGNDQMILVGFPDEFATMNIKGQEDVMEVNTVGPINDFKTYINGLPVKSTVKYQILDKTDFDNNPVKFKELWHTFPVNFKAGTTTVIRNTYWVENGIDVLNARNFRYTIKTGKKWKGLIGNTKIYVNFKHGLTINSINKEFSNKGMKVINNKKALWEYSNFEPDENEGTGYFYILFDNGLIDLVSKRLLTPQDLQGMSPRDLKILRNEIYARHGRPFKSESLQMLFASHSWYKVNPNYSDNLLNSFEKKNATIILNQEKKIGSKIIYTDTY